MQDISTRFRLETLPAARIQAIRRAVASSTVVFERRFGVPASTVTNWEQGRRRPDPAATLLLRLIEADAAFVERVAQAR